MRKIDIPKSLLTSLYVDNKMTLEQIAEELGVSRQTIANKLNSYGINIRPNCMKPKSRKVIQSKPKEIKPYMIYENFNEVYSELKSIQLVAEHYGINIKTAHTWKTRLNIPTIKSMSSLGVTKLNYGKPYTNRETLVKYYDKYSIYDLAKLWDCNPTTISKWLRKFNIPRKTLKEQWERKAKNGNVVVTDSEFRLSDYLNTYSNKDRLSKKVVLRIKDIVGACQSCGEKDVLDLHHIDENRSNNLPSNHVILCPNCHAKVHRLGMSVSELCPNYVSWDEILNNGGIYNGR